MAKKPKFVFDENVEVTTGFFKGQKGKVKNVKWFNTLFRVWGHNFPEGSEYFTQDELRSLDNPRKEFDAKLDKIIKEDE